MATKMGSLATTDDWHKFLTEAGIPREEATTYAKTLVENRIKDPSDLTRDILRELGIAIIGDAIAILKYAKPQEQKMTAGKTSTVPGSKHHRPQIPLPRLTVDMRHKEIDLNVYKTVM